MGRAKLGGEHGPAEQGHGKHGVSEPGEQGGQRE